MECKPFIHFCFFIAKRGNQSKITDTQTVINIKFMDLIVDVKNFHILLLLMSKNYSLNVKNTFP